MILYQFLMALASPVVLADQAVFGLRGAVAERLGLFLWARDAAGQA